MKTHRRGPRNIDEYIAGFPRDVRVILQKIRMTIRKAAPHAEETISYQIPTFTLNGKLIYFAAYEKHIGLYPAPKGTAKFQKELSPFKAAKATVRFPLDKPIPLSLIREIVKFMLRENLERTAAKRKEKQRALQIRVADASNPVQDGRSPHLTDRKTKPFQSPLLTDSRRSNFSSLVPPQTPSRGDSGHTGSGGLMRAGVQLMRGWKPSKNPK